MKKIVLAACNAKYIHSNLAVYCLRAYAKQYGEEVVLKEYTINQQKDDILRDLFKQCPDVVCFSCYIWNISMVRAIMVELAKILPETEIWVGGPEVSFLSEEFLQKNPAVKGVMVGEGEKTFLELVRYYHGTDEKKLQEIEGLVFREKQEIITTRFREPMNLSEVPFVYEDLTDFEHRIIYYESSRGCPFSCSYCLSSIDKKLRFRSLDLVKKELQFFIDHKVPQVKFVDRTFNCKHDHAKQIWEYITEHDNGITNFHFEVAADLLTEEELELIGKMRPGLIQLEIGVQSTNPDTIEEIHRKMDFQEVSRIVNRIHSVGNIHQHLDLIVGLPYENLESFKRSFRDVYELQPEQLQLGFLKVLKGSWMYEQAQNYQCTYQDLEPYEVLSTKWLSYKDVLLLKSVESMVELYYNSGQYHHTLEYILPFFDGPFEFYEALGSYYEEKGYDLISHARIRRYEILLEFLQSLNDVDVLTSLISIDTVKEKMLIDLYERENMKTRPGWAPSLKPYDAALREYRRKNQIAKTAHMEVLRNRTVLLFDYEKKSKLTNNAKITELDWEEIEHA